VASCVAKRTLNKCSCFQTTSGMGRQRPFRSKMLKQGEYGKYTKT
jgi:hypothetical protein